MSSETITRSDLTNILNKVLPIGMSIADGIATREFSLGTRSETYYLEEIDVSYSGYTPIHVGWTTNQVGMALYRCSIDHETNKVYIGRYLGGAPLSSNTMVIYVTYIKNEIIERTMTPSVVDYIVEEGTEGIWTYRKWNSGIAECWGIASSTTAFAVWTAPIYYGTTSVAENFPTDLFNSVPNLNVSMRATGADVWVGSSSSGGLTATNTGQYYPLRVGSSGSSVPYRTYFCAKGRWK